MNVGTPHETLIAGSIQPQGGRLSVRGLRKSCDGREVLKGISFEVNAGEIFVIMGPSSCGKSVLLRQLIGLEQQDQGEVIYISGAAGAVGNVWRTTPEFLVATGFERDIVAAVSFLMGKTPAYLG
jgi:ABC-type transport system involved in cytochrome bd biosynthesis fused ATPase/permease subunit